MLCLGTDGIIKRIRDRVGTINPVYLSIDIDTLDPACKPAPNSPILSNLTKSEIKLPLLPAHPKPVAGQPVNSAQSSAVLTDSTLLALISLRLPRHMILMQS